MAGTGTFIPQLRQLRGRIGIRHVNKTLTRCNKTPDQKSFMSVDTWMCLDVRPISVVHDYSLAKEKSRPVVSFYNQTAIDSAAIKVRNYVMSNYYLAKF